MKKLTPETARKYCEIAENAYENGDDWAPKLGGLVQQYALDFAPVFRACDAYEIESVEVSYAQNKADFMGALFVNINVCGFWVSVVFAENEDDFSAVAKITHTTDYKSVCAAFDWVCGPKGEAFLGDDGKEIGDFIKSWISANR